MSDISFPTLDLIASKGPKYPFLGMSMGGTDAIKCHSMADGTTSIVQITLYGNPIGQGISKRHPSDARNHELGMALALVRALTDAASRYAVTVDGMLNPREDPSHVAIKQLRRLGKADTQRRKDIRRKAAREAHREIMGWDHTTRVGIKDWPKGLDK